MWVHRIAGTVILVITIVMSLYGMKKRNWQLLNEPHYILGLIVIFGIAFLVASGIITRS